MVSCSSEFLGWKHVYTHIFMMGSDTVMSQVQQMCCVHVVYKVEISKREKKIHPGKSKYVAAPPEV